MTLETLLRAVTVLLVLFPEARVFAARGSDGSLRVAPLTVVATEAPAGLVLADPLIADRTVPGLSLDGGDGNEWLTVIESFRFKIDQVPAGLKSADAALEIESCTGIREHFQVRVDAPASGDEIRIPADYPVDRSIEGPFRAGLTLTGPDGRSLFTGEYGFGYPRFHTAAGLERVHCGAAIRDDFRSDAVDEELWRIWRSNPDKFRCEQRDGRYWIHIDDRVGYNGLASRVEMDTRDVVLVCRAGIESEAGAGHGCLIHLCGSGSLSPDHWFEVQLYDRDGKTSGASLGVTVPARYREGDKGPIEIPQPAPDGFLVKITSSAADHLCRGYIMIDGSWTQIGQAFEVPARKARVEIKTGGGEPGGGSSVLWFDDCRLYPRPENHYVSVSLQRSDGRTPGTRNQTGWPPYCFDASNRRVSLSQVTVKLFAADGATPIDEIDVGQGFGYGLLKLNRAPWDIYPVPAIIRVFFGEEQIGPDQVIECDGVEGLYPDDVYKVVLN